MATQNPDKKPSDAAQDREDRLKAALKANMARRKAQARGRQAQDLQQDVGGNEAESED